MPRGLGPVGRLPRRLRAGRRPLGRRGCGAAFTLETDQALLLTPLRLARAGLSGDRWFLLEPLRTAKNLLWDTLWVAAGIANCASAPLWNALRPDEATDFQYARNRLIFYGGPIAAVIKDSRYARAMAPSWHTVFATREFGSPWLRHEFVHNKQIARSFVAERVGEDYRGFGDWRPQDADEYLNW